jgi:hypothetical protein
MYIHRAELFDLHQDDIALLDGFATESGARVPAIRARFWIWNPRSKQSSGEFGVVYGISGALAGVPLQMTYQPNWWLRTEFRLDETPLVPARP